MVTPQIALVKIEGSIGVLSQSDKETLAAAGTQSKYADYQRGQNHPQVLVSQGSTGISPQHWVAGITSLPPYDGTGSHTVETNWVNVTTDNPEPGHAWPYMVPGALMESNLSNALSLTGYYPSVPENAGVNGYRRGIMLRAGWCGGNGARLHIQFIGTLGCAAPGNITNAALSSVNVLEVVLAPNLVTSWSGGNTTAFPADTVYFRSPAYSHKRGKAPNRLPNDNANPFICDIWGTWCGPHVVSWTCDWTFGAGTGSIGAARPPLLQQRRFQLWSFSTVDFEIDDVELAFLYKVDHYDSTPLTLASEIDQDGSITNCRGYHFSATLYPGV